MTEPSGILELAPGRGATGPTLLDIDKLETVARFGPFGDGLPDGWRPDTASGTWETRDGFLYGSVTGNLPAILWFEQKIEGDHGIWFQGSAVKRPGEDPAAVARYGNLNCIWGSTRLTTSTLAVSGFAGWYSGLCGVELYDGGEVVLRSVSATPRLEAGRSYRVFGGRTGNRDFLFIDEQLATEVVSEASHASPSHVAVSTYGYPGGSALVKIESIVIFKIPPQAVRPPG